MATALTRPYKFADPNKSSPKYGTTVLVSTLENLLFFFWWRCVNMNTKFHKLCFGGIFPDRLSINSLRTNVRFVVCFNYIKVLKKKHFYLLWNKLQRSNNYYSKKHAALSIFLGFLQNNILQERISRNMVDSFLQ